MIVIEESLRTALIAMSEVTDLVSTRIWDEWFRSDTVPAIMFEIDSEERENDLEGRGGLVFASVNIVCRAGTRAGSRALAEAVRTNGTDEPGDGLAGYSGDFDAWLEDTTPAAVPKKEGSKDHWYDTNLGFVMSWPENK